MDFKVAAKAKSCEKVKVSHAHATVKCRLTDRRAASPVVRTLEEFSSYNSNLIQCRLHDNEIENFCVSNGHQVCF